MKRKTTEEFVNDIENLYPGKYSILEEYTGRNKRVKVKYNKCGHIKNTVADKIYKGKNCPVCCGGIRLTQKEFEEKSKTINPHLKIIGTYKGARESIEVLCDLCGCKSTPLADAVMNKKMSGCAVCSAKIIIKGFNDLWTTDKEVAKLLKNPEDGYKISRQSDKVLDFICPICGKIIKKAVKTVVIRGVCCQKCSNRISYPERFMKSVLEQLRVEYKFQKTFEWSKDVTFEVTSLCGLKIYDFYLEKNNIIIETHGKQHYQDNCFSFNGSRSLFEEQKNDILKYDLAKSNGIDIYVSLDCRISDMNYIKNSILNSQLSDIFDLSNINWNECNKYALSSKVEEASSLWNDGYDVNKISKIMHLCKATIRTYLHIATDSNICNYNISEARNRRIIS